MLSIASDLTREPDVAKRETSSEPGGVEELNHAAAARPTLPLPPPELIESVAVRPLGVAALGLDGRERATLRRILALTTSRTHRYTLMAETANEVADLFLVDASNPNAAKLWRELRARRQLVPSIFITSVASIRGPQAIHRPLRATRVLTALDGLAEILVNRPQLVVPRSEGSGDSVASSREMSLARATPAPRILIVDDSVTARVQIGKALERAHIAADLVDDGERALELLTTERYDMVLLDVVMPGIDGYEVCKLIRRNRATRHAAVVMLTAKGSPFDLVKGRLAGCDSYLTKPVKLRAFKRTLELHLKRRLTFGSGLPERLTESDMLTG